GERAGVHERRRLLGAERRRQRGGAGGAGRSRDSRDDIPGGTSPRAGPRAVGRQGRHDDRAVRAEPGADLGCRAARGRLHARRHADPGGRRRARPPVAQADLQRGDEPDRRADGSDARPRRRGRRSASPRLPARRRGEGGRGRPGHRARRRPRGADRPCRAAGRRLRPQGEHAPGRRGPKADRDRLPERRHRPLRPRAGRAHAFERRGDGSDQGLGGIVGAVSPDEVERRYANVREALARDGLDAVIVSGSEYSGFEGAVRYMSGFVIVHRYAYMLLPLEGDPSIVFPVEARYVGEHEKTWIDEQVFVDAPGAWLRDRAADQGWGQVGVYGLDYVMTVRDYRALADDGPELVPYDVEFDLARAVKSGEELASVRDSVRINAEGFWIFLDGFAAGRSEAELLAPCEQYFVEQGC